MIFGYHAQIGVIRTFIGWERGFWHLFAREFCPGSDSNVKRDLRESFAKREKSWHQSATRNTTRALQNACWLDQHWFATLRLGHNPPLGHLILFLSRLNFIFAAAVFSAVYLVRFNELDISLWGFVYLSTVLFSIFCYTLELERLGRALVERKDHS
jgi:hypothetical protein